MKFSTREDIEAPIVYVFERVSDFAAFEKRAIRHGADVRCESEGPAVTGTAWDVGFQFRGRTRRMRPVLSRLDPPNGYLIETMSDGLTATSEVTLVALSPTRTRVLVGLDLRARTLTARLLLQSLKLAKAKLNDRFKARVLDFAEDIEDDYRRES